MTTSDELIAVLATDPTDFDLFLVIADLLEEEGKNNLSIAYRWCGMTKKRPRQEVYNKKWSWSHNHNTYRAPSWNEARLPKETKHGTKDFLTMNTLFAGADTFLAAMQTLADNLELAGVL